MSYLLRYWRWRLVGVVTIGAVNLGIYVWRCVG